METIFERNTKKRNCNTILNKIRNVNLNLYYARKRMKYGYDDRDIFAFNDQFRERMVLLLTEYKKTHIGSWWVPQSYQDSLLIDYCDYDSTLDKKVFSEEQTNIILEMMIFHFKMSDFYYVADVIADYDSLDERLKYEAYYQDVKRIERIRVQNQNAAMELLTLFMDQLWN